MISDQRQQRGLRHSSDLLKIIASCVSLDCDALEDPAARECAAEEYRTRGQLISQSESSLHRLLHPWLALTGHHSTAWFALARVSPSSARGCVSTLTLKG